jgi:hypothetical protein
MYTHRAGSFQSKNPLIEMSNRGMTSYPSDQSLASMDSNAGLTGSNAKKTNANMTNANAKTNRRSKRISERIASIPNLTQAFNLENLHLMSTSDYKPRRILSICGTVADIIGGLVMSFVAPFLEVYLYISNISRRHRKALKLKSHRPVAEILSRLGEIFMMLVLFPVYYIPYVLNLIKEALVFQTHVELHCGSESTKCIVHYETRNVYEKPPKLGDGVDKMHIKLLRAENLTR